MKITSCVAFEDNFLMNLNEEVPAYKADDNGEMVQTTDTSFSMSYADLARQLYGLCPLVSAYRGVVGQHISGDAFIVILTHAEIKVDFTFAKEGDTVGDYVADHTGYIKTLKSVKLSDTATSLLMNKLGSAL